jgi:hypothetical protein
LNVEAQGLAAMIDLTTFVALGGAATTAGFLLGFLHGRHRPLQPDKEEEMALSELEVLASDYDAWVQARRFPFLEPCDLAAELCQRENVPRADLCWLYDFLLRWQAALDRQTEVGRVIREETDNPIHADRRIYKVEKWSKDGMRVVESLFAGTNLDKVRHILTRGSG